MTSSDFHFLKIVSRGLSLHTNHCQSGTEVSHEALSEMVGTSLFIQTRLLVPRRNKWVAQVGVTCHYFHILGNNLWTRLIPYP